MNRALVYEQTTALSDALFLLEIDTINTEKNKATIAIKVDNDIREVYGGG
jgi:hypothetical protein